MHRASELLSCPAVSVLAAVFADARDFVLAAVALREVVLAPTQKPERCVKSTAVRGEFVRPEPLVCCISSFFSINSSSVNINSSHLCVFTPFPDLSGVIIRLV